MSDNDKRVVKVKQNATFMHERYNGHKYQAPDENLKKTAFNDTSSRACKVLYSIKGKLPVRPKKHAAYCKPLIRKKWDTGHKDLQQPLFLSMKNWSRKQARCNIDLVLK